MLSLFRSPQLPVTAEERAWIEGAFERLIVVFGRDALTGGMVVPPTDEYLPEWDGTPECVAPLLRRVCAYLSADPDALELELAPDRADELRRTMPVFGSRGWQASSLSHDDHESAPLIVVKASLLPYPIALIAALSQKVAQWRLVAEPRVGADAADLEALADIVTVFYGMGIFTANSSVRFEQSNRSYRVQRQGALTQQQWAHALAEYARLHGEAKPTWARYLSTDIKAYFDQSHAVLRCEAR